MEEHVYRVKYREEGIWHRINLTSTFHYQLDGNDKPLLWDQFLQEFEKEMKTELDVHFEKRYPHIEVEKVRCRSYLD